MAQYESYRGQGGNPSPYAQAGNPYDEDTSYGGNPYSQGQYDRQQGGYGMSTLRSPQGQALGQQLTDTEMNTMNPNNPNRILDETTAINTYCEELEARQDRLAQIQTSFVSGTSQDSARPLQIESENLLNEYRKLVARTKRLKSDRDSGNPRNAPQVGRVDRRVKASMNKFQQLDSNFRKNLAERMEREYKIVNPDATDAEARAAAQDPDAQVYTQALLNSNRLGQANSVRQAVNARHEALQKIEKDMIALAEMFQDLDAIVVQQEAQVTSIEARGEEVQDHVTKANVELDGAVTKARAARKKKWICLGIGVAVIVVIAIIIAVVVSIQNSNKNNNPARLLMTL